MNDKQILLDHLISKNKETLDSNQVTLTVNDLDFNRPEAGSFPGSSNTRIVASMRPARKVTGSHIYYYSRNDLQEAFKAIGVDTVTVEVDGEPNIGKVIVALQNTYNLNLDPNEVIDIEIVENEFTFGVRPTSLLWIGKLTVIANAGETTPLDVAFPNNILDGFTPPDFS